MKKILIPIMVILGFSISSRVFTATNTDANKQNIKIEDNVYTNGFFKVKIHGPVGWQVMHKEDLYFRRVSEAGPMVNGIYFQVNYFSESPRGTKDNPHFILLKGLKEDRYKDLNISTAQVVDGVIRELKNITNLKIVQKPAKISQKGREWIKFVFELGPKWQENYYYVDHKEGVLYIYSAGSYHRTIKDYLDSTFESIDIQN